MKQRIIRTLLFAVMVIASLTANAQVKAFEKYADIKNVSYVFISKYMLGMANKTTYSIPGVNVKSLASKLTGIQIITSEEKTARTKLKADVKNLLAQDKYEVLMQIKEDDSKVDIYYSVNKQQSAVVMFADEDDEVAVMVFSGHFTMDDVMKMTKD